MTPPREGTHCARVLEVLSDGRAHTTRDLYRRAGPMVLHSRVAQLRKQGYRIECEHIDGKGTGAGAYRYTWLDAPAQIPNLEAGPQLTTDEIAPRTESERFRIFRVRNGGAPEIVATVATREALGVAICTLGAEGEFDDYCIGVMDALDHQDKTGKWVGKWLVLPYQKGI